jgi:hypothetical protein
MPKRPFALGRIFVAGEVLDVAGASEIIAALHRHQTGDWGECTPSDWKWNDEALAEENTIYSAYRSKSGVRFTIVTSEDRTLTTIAAPRLYYALGESCWFMSVSLWLQRLSRRWRTFVQERRLTQLEAERQLTDVLNEPEP